VPAEGNFGVEAQAARARRPNQSLRAVEVGPLGREQRCNPCNPVLRAGGCSSIKVRQRLASQGLHDIAGLPPNRLRDLRHGSASYALAAGIPIKVVSEDLGHSTTKITEDVYTSVLPELKQSAATAVAATIPRSAKRRDVSIDVLTPCSPTDISGDAARVTTHGFHGKPARQGAEAPGFEPGMGG
jgi:hypothetical protein